MTTQEQQRHLEVIKRDTARLAESLREASDAGVSHMLILPQLIIVFREAFGEMPPNLAAQLATITPEASR